MTDNTPQTTTPAPAGTKQTQPEIHLLMTSNQQLAQGSISRALDGYSSTSGAGTSFVFKPNWTDFKERFQQDQNINAIFIDSNHEEALKSAIRLLRDDANLLARNPVIIVPQGMAKEIPAKLSAGLTIREDKPQAYSQVPDIIAKALAAQKQAATHL